MSSEGPRGVTEGDALRYEAQVDLSETNTARTQLVLMTGENKKVLEVGPATGYITKALTERGCRVTGLEIDPAAAEVSGELAERMIVGDIEAMDLEEVFGDERFDVVMYGDVLEHLVDPQKVLVATRSILAPGGSVVASIPNVAHGSVRLALLTGEFRYRPDGLLDRTHLRFFTRESIHALFHDAGYDVEETRVSTTGPFGTEMGLKAEEFPPALTEAVMSLPDAETYQFILTARPAAVTAAQAAQPEGETGERAAPLWRVENDLAERERALEKLTEEVEWLRDVASRAEEDRDGARAELRRVQGSSTYRVARGLVRRFRRVFPRRKEKPPPGGQARPADYREWIERFEPGPEELEAQRGAPLRYRPLVSVIIPTSDPSSVRETIGSVRAQTYDRWELRMAETAEEAVAAAKGELLAFVGPGDLLAPFALHEVAAALNADPGLDVVYSDRDHISGDMRFDPVFTPELSPELLLSSDYMLHLLVVRRDAYDQVGGLRPEMGSERLWDLTLRLVERTDRVARVPLILYHGRAASPEPASERGRAVRAHLDRRGRGDSVEPTADGHLRIRWRVESNLKVSLIIPTRHNRPMLRRCLAALDRASYRNREVLVVETAGRDPDREAWYRDLAGQVEVLWWDRPFSYSAVNNWAAKQATGDILVFLNDDTDAVGEDWLTELVGWAAQEEVGAVGAQLLNEDGTIQHGGIVVGLTGFAGQLFKFLKPGDSSLLGSTMWYRNVSAVTGACLAMRREVFDRVGGWDERYLLAGSDVELGLRLLRQGYRVVCTPFAQLRHTEQATRGDDIPEQDFHTSFEDYRQLLEVGDPYFSPNLDYDSTIPRLTTGEFDPMEMVSAIIGEPS